MIPHLRLMGCLFFLGRLFACFIFFFYFCSVNQLQKQMNKLQTVVVLLVVSVVLVGCGKKKKSEDIIAPRVEKVKLTAPVSMQDYSDDRNVQWLDKDYHIAIRRQPCDSLAKVKDETGQEYIDNVFTVVVSRADGSVFFKRKFTKASVSKYLDDDYRKTGIFEGLVFDRIENDLVYFGASVGHPQTDEYIPLVITLSRMGDIRIQRDTQMDTGVAPVDQDKTKEGDDI